jgi:hypothetical protein
VNRWSIDGHPFRDDDGSLWLFYSARSEETRFHGAEGTGTMCDRLLAPDRLDGTPTRVTFPSQRWEGNPEGDWFWNEAPYVLKRRGWYHQMYSGGFFAEDTYAVGCATARAVSGRWQKRDDNPIFAGRGRFRGPGHNSFVFGPDVASPYAVYHAYVGDDPGRKVNLDRLVWTGDLPTILGPTDGEQPAPPPPVFDPRVPHWRSEAWARGRWVEVGGARFALAPASVWHQVEVVQVDGRFAVRIGGVLRASRPAEPGLVEPLFSSDGEVAFVTASSALSDGAVHELPAGSSYVWRWSGEGKLELTLAVDGSVELVIGDETTQSEGERGAYRLVQFKHAGPAGEISVHAGDDGAVVTDLAVYARP